MFRRWRVICISLSCFVCFLRVTVRFPPHPWLCCSPFSTASASPSKWWLVGWMFQWLLNSWALNFGGRVCLSASQRAVALLVFKMRTMLMKWCLALVSDHLKCNLIWEAAFKPLFTKRFWLSFCRNFCWVKERWAFGKDNQMVLFHFGKLLLVVLNSAFYSASEMLLCTSGKLNIIKVCAMLFIF